LFSVTDFPLILFLISFPQCLCVFWCWFMGECVCTDGTKAVSAELIRFIHTHTHTWTGLLIEALQRQVDWWAIKDVQWPALLWRHTEESEDGFIMLWFYQSLSACLWELTSNILDQCVYLHVNVFLLLNGWSHRVAASQRHNYPMIFNSLALPSTPSHTFTVFMISFWLTYYISLIQMRGQSWYKMEVI